MDFWPPKSPPERCHELIEGKRSGQISVDLDHPYRLIFIPELPKAGVYGATRWLGDKAVIQLSLRYKSNDHLWFTFFHEAGHIIRHGRKEIFIEGNGMDSEKTEINSRSFSAGRIRPGKGVTAQLHPHIILGMQVQLNTRIKQIKDHFEEIKTEL